MRFTVLGAGMVGRAIVFDLCRREEVTEVRLADCSLEIAEEVASRYGNGKATPCLLDASNEDEVRKVVSGSVVAIGAISYRFNEMFTRIAIDEGVHFVDLGGNNDVVSSQFALSKKAVEANVAIVPDCGIAPGAVSIFAARLLELMPTADTVKLRVGGLPLNPLPPFNYQVVFSVEGLINEYKEETVSLKNGEIITRPSLVDLELVEFPEPFGILEAFNTSGGASTLPHTFKDRLKNLDYKTLRYQGHCNLINALFALGLSDEEPVLVDGVRIAPRKLLQHQISKTLSTEGPDVILTLIEAIGSKGKVSLRIIDKADEKTGLSAMARCTAFPATTIAVMLATGGIEARGTLKQEESIPAERFIEELRHCGIDVVIEEA
jgi:lysine 6-dehydrogenase